MKPTVPETGNVIRVEGDFAVVLLRAEKSCKGCGAAAIGLCKPSGGMSMVTVRNTRGAVPGDTVKMALDKQTQRKGFLLAYFIPIASLIGGSVLGYVLNDLFAVSSLDVISAFAAFFLSSVCSFRGLMRLDNTSSMTIKEIVRENHFSCPEPGQPFWL